MSGTILALLGLGMILLAMILIFKEICSPSWPS